MTDDTDSATIPDVDGIDVEVADDPTNSRTIVTGLTISGKEKVSTGDYENYEPFQQVQAVLDPAIDASTPDGYAEVRNRALNLHKAVQKDLQRAVDNRLADPDFEDW